MTDRIAASRGPGRRRWGVEDRRLGRLRRRHLLGAARGGGSNHQFSGLDGAMDALDATIAAALGAAGGRPGAPARHSPPACTAWPAWISRSTRSGSAPAIEARGWSFVGPRPQRHPGRAQGRRPSRDGASASSAAPGSTASASAPTAPSSGSRPWPSCRAISRPAVRGSVSGPSGSPCVHATGAAARRHWPPLVPAHFGLPDPEAVLTAVYTGALDYGRLFELARVCLDAAANGDDAAAGAVGFLAEEIVAMGAATVERLGATDEPIEIVLGGGLFDSEHSVLRRRGRGGGPPGRIEGALPPARRTAGTRRGAARTRHQWRRRSHSGPPAGVGPDS